MSTNKVIFQITDPDLSTMSPNQLGIETAVDGYTEYKMMGYKDEDGTLRKVLCKDEQARVSGLRATADIDCDGQIHVLNQINFTDSSESTIVSAGPLNISGPTTSMSFDVNPNNIEIYPGVGRVNVNGDLGVAGDTSCAGNISCLNTLTLEDTSSCYISAYGPLYLQAPSTYIAVGGATPGDIDLCTRSGKINVTGDEIISGNLDCSGAARVLGRLQTTDDIYFDGTTGNYVESLGPLNIQAPNSSISLSVNTNDIDLYASSGKVYSHGDSYVSGDATCAGVFEVGTKFKVFQTAIQNSVNNSIAISGNPTHNSCAFTVEEQVLLHPGDKMDIIHDVPPGGSVLSNKTGSGFIYGSPGLMGATMVANFNWFGGPGGWTSSGVELFSATGDISAVEGDTSKLVLCNINLVNDGYVNILRLENNKTVNLLVGYKLTYWEHGSTT